MKWLLFSSLRTKLILLVLIAIIPALIITLYSGLEQRKHARLIAFDKALDLSKEISKDHQQLIETARQILFTLSQMSQISEHNTSEYSKIFINLLKQTQGYTSFAAVKPNGDVFTSAHPLDRPINFADRPWFKRVVKTKSFVIGEYLIGRITGKPTIILAYPVLDSMGHLKSIFITGLDLEWLNLLIAESNLPKESSLSVIDSNGTILLRYPNPEKFVGKSMPETSIVKTILAKKEGVEEAVGLEGVPRLFGFTSLGKGVESVHVSVGIPQKIAFQESNRIFARNLIFIGLIGILALVAAWFIGGLFVLQPVNRLLKVTNRLADGDLTVRSGPIYGSGEISQLASAFDQMAESLQFREEERKRSEERLRQSEEKYRSIFESIYDVYYRINIDGKIMLVSPSVLPRAGYDPEELIGQDVSKIYFNPSDRDLFLEKIKETGVLNDYEVKFKAKDGGVLNVSLTANLISDKDGNPVAIEGILRDITGRKKAEQEMIALQEQFRQSQKMEAIGKLAGGVAHDFNNLLTIIKGYCQLSLPTIKEGDPLKENIEEVVKASDRAADLTRQLLAFSRRQIMEMRVLDLNHILRNLDKMLRRMIGEDVELKTLLADDLGKVKADPGQIEQVLMNLVVNARDAMPKGGKLTIETANIKLDEKYARNHIAVTPGDYVMIAVSDTGIGMSPEVRERVFEPFFTTKERGKGTGLGLSTVYGIVKQSDGNIWVYSEPGKGTTFKIYLPKVDEPAEELRVKVERPELPRGSETVLVVEDDEKVRKLSVKILEKHGYEVIGAGSGEEALEICRERKKPIHLVLTDVVMPGMDGRQLTKKLMEVCHGFKVLYMSGYTDNAITHHGVLERGLDFIQKPLSIEGLVRKVREVLDK